MLNIIFNLIYNLKRKDYEFQFKRLHNCKLNRRYIFVKKKVLISMEIERKNHFNMGAYIFFKLIIIKFKNITFNQKSKMNLP